MKCMVINLDRSPDRLAHVTAEFAKVGVSFDRVPAVDALRRPEFAATSPSLTPTEAACLMSHKVCWTIIADGEDAFGAIFEDDVLLSEAAGPMLSDDGWIPANADIVKLETYLRKTVIAMKRTCVSRVFSVVRLYGFHVGAAGYIISKQAARDLIARSLDAPADHVIFDPALPTSSSKAIYQLLPALCVQNDLIREKAFGLTSLLNEERLVRARANSAPKRSPAEKLLVEARRISRQIFDICRFRREKTISLA
ncbi:glycosyltransferase family 25 protein [Mesorhizobium sp. BR1-1-3]|uniref:glycosyltransferase family 25 protein n=1 Tax=unclassified Mesorhizobium TaxID=325217 RepID=UPI000FCBF0D5|nr:MULTISPECIES: glycosyltransferase family 25 protein [unclassified Mesorhizobium]MBZ9887057.1 glycosyltransferase family 25 protein [Mesorhizobium sp. BR1-1-3]RUY30599.1 glycosyltransferase family 25 protein [Mesorhizobium sp. M7A.F.Ca.US.001.04.2.1]RUY35322.1 glycosyltransferase family 25 protein [Mesorhizobium sp. M7A.F.Ca.US.001.04.1.1]